MVTRGDLLDRPHILYFGFTTCVDLCPTTLYQISSGMGALGHRADPLKVAFVSVDPERDTPEVLRRYMSAFDPRMMALTGRPDEIAQAAAAYRIFYRKIDLGAGDYTMDHTPSALLFRRDGTMAGTIAAQDTDMRRAPRLQHSSGWRDSAGSRRNLPSASQETSYSARSTP